jgi:hypothetical protein
MGLLSVASCQMATVLKTPKGGTVTVFRQSGAGKQANVFWFDTQSGPVVIDLPAATNDAKKLRTMTIRPYRVYISAAAPERFGGIGVMRADEVPVISTPAISADIAANGDAKLRALAAGSNKIPTHVDSPSPTIDERTHDLVGDVEVELLPIGAAASASALAIYLPKTQELIASDLIMNQTHAELSAGAHLDEWLARLSEFQEMHPKYVYPGHGEAGGPQLIDATIAYLKYMRDLVGSRAKPGAPAVLPAALIKQLTKTVKLRYQKYDHPEYIGPSLQAVYASVLAANNAAADAKPPAPVTPPPAPVTPPPAPSKPAKATKKKK